MEKIINGDVFTHDRSGKKFWWDEVHSVMREIVDGKSPFFCEEDPETAGGC